MTDTATAATSEDESLVISFPARAGFLRICRLNAAAFGADLGFSVEGLDDLRLAVVEAVTWLMLDEEAGGSIELRLHRAGDAVVMTAERSGADLPEQEIGDLVHAILGATVDRYQISTTEAGGRRLELEKQCA